LPESDPVHKRWERFREEHANSGDCTHADLYMPDRLVLEMASPEELRAQASGLYQRYCDERGEAVDPSDPAMKRPGPDTPEPPEEVKFLRAFCRSCVPCIGSTPLLRSARDHA
jgi:hypothetical protein